MLREGILGAANALGIKPIDLATAISYETAGTFDPTKAGPTTQWGQHRGLIQWGEPQAKKYGVDWNDPVGSQLGEGGAVVRYLKDAGVQPGMGLLDVYSAINAGQVGRYNASDANNGGAPGTVADKVNKQMAGHRQKALSLLGETPQTTMSTKGTPMAEPEQQRGLLFNMLGPKAQNYLTPERVARAQMALEGMTLNPNQGVMEAAKATLGTAADSKQRNKTAEWLAKQGRTDLAEGVMSGAVPANAALQAAMTPPKDERTGTQKNYEFFTNGLGLSHDDAIKAMGGGGTNISVNTGPTGVDYGKPPTDTAWQRDEQGNVVLDERGAPIALPVQGGAAYRKEQEEEAARVAADTRQALQGEQQEVKASAVSNAVDTALGIMEKSGPLDIIPEAGVGGKIAAMVGNQEATDLRNTLSTIQASVAFDTLQKMREASKTGGALGAVSERELDLLMSAFGALQQDTSPELLRRNLTTIKSIMGKIESDPVASQMYNGGTATAAPSTVPDKYRKYLEGQ